MSPRAAQIRIYVDADVLGLGKILAGLRNDVTYPGDPGALIHKRQRARAGSGLRGYRCSGGERSRERWRWYVRGGTGRRACRWTRLISVGARTGRRPGVSTASRYRRTAGPTGPRGAVISWAVMKSVSLTSAACAGCLEVPSLRAGSTAAASSDRTILRALRRSHTGDYVGVQADILRG